MGQEPFATLLSVYYPAIISLSALAVVALVSMLTANIFKFFIGKHVAGQAVDTGHDDLTYRMVRSSENLLENLGVITLTIVVAILSGASADWVNIMAIILLGARLAHWFFYAIGIAPLRTLSFVTGVISMLVLAVATFIQLI